MIFFFNLKGSLEIYLSLSFYKSESWSPKRWSDLPKVHANSFDLKFNIISALHSFAYKNLTE